MSEKFILNTVFKHETKPINEQAIRDYLAFVKEETSIAITNFGKNLNRFY